jgi:hypothetical protein
VCVNLIYRESLNTYAAAGGTHMRVRMPVNTADATYLGECPMGTVIVDSGVDLPSIDGRFGVA